MRIVDTVWVCTDVTFHLKYSLTSWATIVVAFDGIENFHTHITFALGFIGNVVEPVILTVSYTLFFYQRRNGEIST